jgi:NAD(P)-dependent dehydrogenase (short-subunit alcohol dehydrogenase family)
MTTATPEAPDTPTAGERGTVLVLGATSAIARATADALARKGYPLYLAGRDGDELDRVSTDIAIRHGVPVRHGAFDAVDIRRHGAFVNRVEKEAGPLAGAVLAFGLLGDPEASRAEPRAADLVLRTNFTGAASVLGHLANHLERQGSGFLVGISSVAGDRGRRGNYVYGAAKAGLTAFLSGLRHRLASRGVRVVTVKPGFVDTAMTFGLPGMFLVASPEAVGARIARAAEGGPEVVYVPAFWRPLMAVIRAIPEPLFKRLDL